MRTRSVGPVVLIDARIRVARPGQPSVRFAATPDDEVRQHRLGGAPRHLHPNATLGCASFAGRGVGSGCSSIGIHAPIFGRWQSHVNWPRTPNRLRAQRPVARSTSVRHALPKSIAGTEASEDPRALAWKLGSRTLTWTS